MKYSESGKGSCPIRLMPPIRNIYDEMSANGTKQTRPYDHSRNHIRSLQPVPLAR